MFSLEEGKKLVEIARKELDDYFKGQEMEKWDVTRKKFQKKFGVFVSIHSYSRKDLRGCIGFPIPLMPLWQAVREAVKSAAFEDGRFLPVSKNELDDVIIEISVLTKPELINEKKPEDIINSVEIGKDGLIIEYSGYSGLLLPQVPVQEKWTAEKFLEQLCMKAGISPKSWKNSSCKISKFQAQIFSEKSPNGEVQEVSLN